jgi:short-subunit dehydrogenase
MGLGWHEHATQLHANQRLPFRRFIPKKERIRGMSFANKVALITGASSGIGHAVAKELAAKGCKVGLLARRLDLLEALARDIQAQGGEAAYEPADVTDRGQTVSAIHKLRDKLGPVDLLLANSGLGLPTQVEPLNVDQVVAMVNVNLLGVIYSIEGVLPDMLRRRQGHLAAVSSLAAYKGLPGESAYCATKAAVNTYMEGLRIQLRRRGIAVTTICPGFIKTPMTDVNQFKMPWLMGVEKAAKKIVRALERRKKVYNFPWQTSVLMRMTRWLPDWVIAKFVLKKTEGRAHPGA